MTDLYVIQKHIPIPPRRHSSHLRWAFINDMEVGDCFVLRPQDYSQCTTYFTKIGYKYQSRKIEDKPHDQSLRRIWRVA